MSDMRTKSRWIAAALMLWGGAAAAQTISPMDLDDCTGSFRAGLAVVQRPVSFDTAPALDPEKWCVVYGVVVESDLHLYVRIGEIRWRVEGYDRSASSALHVEMSEVGFLPHAGDPVTDYLLAVQFGAGGFDVTLHYTWDQATRQLTLHQASAFFNEDNNITLSGEVIDVDMGAQVALPDTMRDARLSALDIVVNSDMLFEQYLAMAIGAPLLEGAADPEARVEELKAQAIAVVESLPRNILDEESIAALATMIGDIPHPRGRLAVGLHSEEGVSLFRLLGYGGLGTWREISDIMGLDADYTVKVDYP